jgi:hypothetical protein
LGEGEKIKDLDLAALPKLMLSYNLFLVKHSYAFNLPPQPASQGRPNHTAHALSPEGDLRNRVNVCCQNQYASKRHG